MRALRLAIAVLVAMTLAAPPVAAGAAKHHGTMLQIGMGAPDDCHCCDTAYDPAADICHLKCCCAAAILVEKQPLIARHAALGVDAGAAGLPLFSRQPDPPPPRP
jgi:hypothetical protein